MAETSDRFVKGLLVGGIIGAAIALLYAPKPGKELREEIKKKSDGIKEDLETGMADTKTVAAHVLDKAIKRADALSKQAEQLIREAQEKAVEIMADSEVVVKTPSETVQEPSKPKKRATRSRNKMKPHSESENQLDS